MDQSRRDNSIKKAGKHLFPIETIGKSECLSYQRAINEAHFPKVSEQCHTLCSILFNDMVSIQTTNWRIYYHKEQAPLGL